MEKSPIIIGILLALAWNFVHHPEAPFTAWNWQGAVIILAGFLSSYFWQVETRLEKLKERLAAIENKLNDF